MKKDWANRTYYILWQESTGTYAHWTLSTNRIDSWRQATKGSNKKPDWIKQGWKCIPVKLQAA